MRTENWCKKTERSTYSVFVYQFLSIAAPPRLPIAHGRMKKHLLATSKIIKNVMHCCYSLHFNMNNDVENGWRNERWPVIGYFGDNIYVLGNENQGYVESNQIWVLCFALQTKLNQIEYQTLDEICLFSVHYRSSLKNGKLHWNFAF